MNNFTALPVVRHSVWMSQKPHQLFSFFIALTLSLSFSTIKLSAQTGTPMFTSVGTSTGGNAFPFGSTSSNHTQFVYTAGEFAGATGGNISAIYVRPTAAVTSTVYTNFTVRMVQQPASFTVFPSGTYLTGLVSCFGPATKTFTSIAANGWMKITLTTPFYYDPTKALIVDIQQNAYSGTPSGFSTQHSAGTGGNKRIYGAYGATSGTTNTTYANMGIDISTSSYNDAGVLSIDSPYTYCSAGTYPVKVTIKNFGRNQVTSVNVNWSVNGTAQTPLYYSSTLDTLGGSGANTAQVTLGSYSFPTTPVDVKAWTSSPNSTTDTVPVNDSAFAFGKQPSLAGGTYTINPSGSGTTNFISFALATAALAKGICGPILFSVAAATYNEQVIIPTNIPGSSAVNTITFDGGNGNASTRIITYSAASTSYPTFFINGAKYVTVRNLTISGTGASYGFGVLIGAGSTGCKINNCVINVTGTSSTSFVALCIGGSITSYTAGGRVDSLLIDSNVISGGYSNIFCYAGSAAIGLQNRFNFNQLSNAYQYPAYFYYQNGISITNNTITGGNYITTNYGMYCSQVNSNGTNAVNISGNKITNFGYYALYI
ncbi:MAG: hypothetical protein ACHQK8_05435, partial [Bacteroidia bacterium]